MRLGREVIYDHDGVGIVRLNGNPRSAVGRDRRLVSYTAPTVTDAELIRPLRAAADAIAKTLPRMPP